MNNAFELLIGSFGAGACWILWFYFAKEQRVDALREELFTIRNELFCMAAKGEISFQKPSYVELRALINGMLRFGEYISLRSLLIAAKLSTIDPDKSSAYQRWRLSVDQEPEEIRVKLIRIHHRMFRTYVNYLVNGSLVLLFITFTFVLRGWYREIKSSMLSRRRPSHFDVMDVAVNQIANNVHASALEEQAYRDQDGTRDLQLA